MDKVKTVTCLSCSAPLNIRGLGRTSTLGCSYCGAIMNIESDELKILSEARRLYAKLKIPLGKRGKFNGITFEVIGHICRTDLGNQFFWSEYLLFNPYHGFRWLSEYNNHWQFVTPLPYLPEIASTHEYKGKSYRLFNQGESKIFDVVGELYWEARRGDTVFASDYICPPHGVSLEEDSEEINASEFQYMTINEIEKAFNLISSSEKLPESIGISLTQPNPYKRGLVLEMFFYGLILFALIGYQIKSVSTCMSKKIVSDTFSIKKNNTSMQSTDPNSEEAIPIFIGPFTLTDKVANLEVKLRSLVDNSWLYAELDLASTDGNFKDEKDIEVSYYHGYDSDGSWYEGSNVNSIMFSSVPPGEYQLMVTPHTPKLEMSPINYPNNFDLKITQDVPYWGNFLVAFLILCIFPAYRIIRNFSFESRRWQESNIEITSSNNYDEEEY